MTLIASIITFPPQKKIGKKNVTPDPRHGTLALDMEPSTLDKKIDSREWEEEHEEVLIWLQVE